MIFKEKKRKKKTSMGGSRTSRLQNLHCTAQLPELTDIVCYKICIYIQYGVSDIRPSTYAIPQFQFLLKKPSQMHNKSNECLEITIL